MRFEITFHTPFRVASGQAGDGSDIAVDRGVLLPASSLKGVTRSAARDLLRFPAGLVRQVFGTARQPSPWAWSDARVTGSSGGGPAVRQRARIQIEAATSTVTSGALAIADEVLAVRAEFSVDRIGWVSPEQLAEHETVLLASARAVTAIGGDRRRGLGWVTITSVGPEWSAEYLDTAAGLAGTGADTDD